MKKSIVPSVIRCCSVFLVCCLIGGFVIVLSQLHGIDFQGKIAIQGYLGLQNSGIFAYNRIFHTIKRMTPLNVLAFSPVWSPRGEKIAFVYSDLNRSNYRIGLLDVNNNAIEALIEKPADGFSLDQDTSLAWSPDGSHLLFDATSDTCHALFLYRLDEKSTQPLPIKFCRSLSGDDVYRLNLTWSPNDNPLIGVSYHSFYYYGDEIYLLDQMLTKQDLVAHGAYPVWRPGTRDFSFICDNTEKDYPNSICLYSMDNSSSRVIVKKYSYDQYTWSPDGWFILFIDKGFHDSDPSILTLVNLKTGNEYRLRYFLTCTRYGSNWWNVGPWIEGKVIWSHE